MPRPDSMPLETSTPQAPDAATARATLSGVKPPARIHRPWGTALRSCQSQVTPAPATAPSTSSRSAPKSSATEPAPLVVDRTDDGQSRLVEHPDIVRRTQVVHLDVVEVGRTGCRDDLVERHLHVDPHRECSLGHPRPQSRRLVGRHPARAVGEDEAHRVDTQFDGQVDRGLVPKPAHLDERHRLPSVLVPYEDMGTAVTVFDPLCGEGEGDAGAPGAQCGGVHDPAVGAGCECGDGVGVRDSPVGVVTSLASERPAPGTEVHGVLCCDVLRGDALRLGDHPKICLLAHRSAPFSFCASRAVRTQLPTVRYPFRCRKT